MINKKITQFLAAALLFSLGAGQTYTSQTSSASAIKTIKNISMTIVIKKKLVA